MRTLQRCTIVLLVCAVAVTSLFTQTRSGKLGIGVSGNLDYILGDGKAQSKLGGDGGASLFYSPTNYLGLRANFGIGKLRWETVTIPKRTKITDYLYGGGYISLDMSPTSVLNPFIFGGGAVVFFTPRRADGTFKPGNIFDIHISGGAGVDYFLSEFWSITFKGEYVYTGSRYYNGDDTSGKDSFLRAGVEIRYYFFDQSVIKKLLDALKERYKK
ncbi:MAG: porin family protein [Bacteroidetes bacterium]|nr:porin family protein [Bacteroidota bacterium]